MDTKRANREAKAHYAAAVESEAANEAAMLAEAAPPVQAGHDEVEDLLQRALEGAAPGEGTAAAEKRGSALKRKLAALDKNSAAEAGRATKQLAEFAAHVDQAFQRSSNKMKATVERRIEAEAREAAASPSVF